MSEESAVDVTEETPKTTSWLFLTAIRGAFRRTRLWLTTWFVLSMMALVVAAPWYGWFAEATAQRVAPGEALRFLSETFRQDHSVGLKGLGDSTSRMAVVLFPAAVLLGIFAAGGWLQVILERSRGRSVRRFCFGGARYFWRFLRVTTCTWLVLAFTQWLIYGMPWKKLVLGSWQGLSARGSNPLEDLATEREALYLGWLQDGVGTLLFMLVLAWATYTRTRLALHDTRSVFWAGASSFFNMLRCPIKTLRPLGFLFVFELVFVTLVLGQLTRVVGAGLDGDGSYARIGVLLAIGSVGLMLRELLRGAKYIAAVRVSQEIIRPTSRLDPWRAIGGPGGPQYPVDDTEDEYGVSM